MKCVLHLIGSHHFLLRQYSVAFAPVFREKPTHLPQGDLELQAVIYSGVQNKRDKLDL